MKEFEVLEEVIVRMGEKEGIPRKKTDEAGTVTMLT
jgi:hypothetical protein